MTAILSTKNATKSLGSIYDYHLLMRTLTCSKLFILDEVPRLLIPPFVRMPRNYTTIENDCEIRFHTGTSYPWSMILINVDEIRMFPPDTPVIPARVDWTESVYDTGLSLPMYQMISNVRPDVKVGERYIPQVNDYDNQMQIAFETADEKLTLPANLVSSFVEPTYEEPTICSRTRNSGKIRFVYADQNNFFQPSQVIDNGANGVGTMASVADPNTPQYLLDYSRYLGGVGGISGGGGGSLFGTNNGALQQEDDQLNQIRNEMDVTLDSAENVGFDPFNTALQSSSRQDL